jgi:hypothetical protein
MREDFLLKRSYSFGFEQSLPSGGWLLILPQPRRGGTGDGITVSGVKDRSRLVY